ncbi:hypothetical protein BC835DRAFT_1349891, partial [Cytidiella melzeri]
TNHLAESLQASPTHAGPHPLELYARACHLYIFHHAAPVFQLLHHATHIAPHRPPSPAWVTYRQYHSLPETHND